MNELHVTMLRRERFGKP